MSFIVVFAFVGLMVLVSSTVFSSPLNNISGFGWSGDKVNPSDPLEEIAGMGWLSFNCTTGGDCATADYGLHLNEQTGAISGTDGPGFAWSPNFGWLQFGGLSGFPTGPGTEAVDAHIVPDGQDGCDTPNGEEYCVRGWARFCSPASAPLSCLGWPGPNTFNGGWDGWVSLSGTTPNSNEPYGVTLNLDENGNNFGGYAWGGGYDLIHPTNDPQDPLYGEPYNNNVTGTGWISFAGLGYSVQYIPLTEPTVFLSVDDTSLSTGDNLTLAWTGTGIVNSPTGCEASGGSSGDGWPGLRESPASPPLVDGGGYITPDLNTPGTYTYSIRCQSATDPNDWSEWSNVIVSVGAQLNFYPSSGVVGPPYVAELNWVAEPSSATLTGCVADSSSVNPAQVPGWLDGSVASPPPLQTASVSVPYPTTFYKLTCYDGAIPRVQTVSVNRGVPTATINLFNSDVLEGPPGVFSSTLTWKSNNIISDTCVATASVAGTGWDDPDAPDDNLDPGVVVGVPPLPAITTYRLTCEYDPSQYDCGDNNVCSGNKIYAERELDQNSGASSTVKPIYTEE